MPGTGLAPEKFFVYALQGRERVVFWLEQVGKSYLFGTILPARGYAWVFLMRPIIRSGWASRAVCWIYDV